MDGETSCGGIYGDGMSCAKISRSKRKIRPKLLLTIVLETLFCECKAGLLVAIGLVWGELVSGQLPLTRPQRLPRYQGFRLQGKNV